MPLNLITKEHSLCSLSFLHQQVPPSRAEIIIFHNVGNNSALARIFETVRVKAQVENNCRFIHSKIKIS
jgi:hypothetical protein